MRACSRQVFVRALYPRYSCKYFCMHIGTKRRRYHKALSIWLIVLAQTYSCRSMRVLGRQSESGNPEHNADEELFTSEWEERYYRGSTGCDFGRASYMWRGVGFGSNMNSELAAHPMPRVHAEARWASRVTYSSPSQFYPPDTY